MERQHEGLTCRGLCRFNPAQYTCSDVSSPTEADGVRLRWRMLPGHLDLRIPSVHCTIVGPFAAEGQGLQSCGGWCYFER